MTVDQLLIRPVEVLDSPLTTLLRRGEYDTISISVKSALQALSQEYDTPAQQKIIQVGTLNFGFELTLTSAEAMERIQDLGLRPATLRELLSFGVAWPEAQRDIPIIGLGTIWPGPDQVPSTIFLFGDDAKRSVHLRRILHPWCSSAHFLVTDN